MFIALNFMRFIKKAVQLYLLMIVIVIYFFVSELHLSIGKYRALDKYNYHQTQYLYKLFIVSKLYV